ncbi:hypothetical protein G6O67_006634 [Ophiocordyceps sinensis]|uniref:Tat pathway signal sequence n=2 Tax=Ophiocordyceps sinensis TaxID=72228 RepID=A0A8H4LW29_9HYPO|nr:hypothetical protein OCS_04161 [Ophiocordyceps sinensis CO18]KAF4506564.1 hypothetical protein G6O67_006634 [Ophiocordyceps sinensis]
MVSAFRLKTDLRYNRDNALLRMTDWYSPVHNEARIDFIDVKVNGTLLDLDHSLFRAPPSPQVDAAWERISSLAPHVIRTDHVLRLGKDPAVTARWSADWGFGPDAHVAELDILHTIHCLNAIRRDVHWRHYFAKSFPDGEFPELHKVHTDHCIYIVLQNLMCGATADIITQPWVESQDHPFPDFSINKRCRDFAAILDWHERTMISDIDKFGTLKMPPGHTPLPMTPEFHRMFHSGQADFHHGHSHG